MRELVDYMIGAESRFEKTTHVLDLFGASQKVAQTWASAGYKGISYDIKLSPAHDVTSRSGFYNLLDLALQLTDTALVVAAPPCSLMSSASQSVCESLTQKATKCASRSDFHRESGSPLTLGFDRFDHFVAITFYYRILMLAQTAFELQNVQTA